MQSPTPGRQQGSMWLCDVCVCVCVFLKKSHTWLNPSNKDTPMFDCWQGCLNPRALSWGDQPPVGARRRSNEPRQYAQEDWRIDPTAFLSLQFCLLAGNMENTAYDKTGGRFGEYPFAGLNSQTNRRRGRMHITYPVETNPSGAL